jgi:glycerophosphoryl diester phosphodiesterase
MSRQIVAVAYGTSPSIISPEAGLVTTDQVPASHAAGLEVVPWTVNTPEGWQRFISAKAYRYIAILRHRHTPRLARKPV